MIRIAASVLILCAVAGCGGERTSEGCLRSDQPNCQICCSDQGFAAECHDGAWTCPSPSVDATQCAQCPPPPASSMAPCVDRDAGACLGCDNGEYCLTTFHCEALDDGGTECADEPDAGFVGDDSCHRHCDFFNNCAPGETCVTQAVNLGCGPASSVGFLCQ